MKMPTVSNNHVVEAGTKHIASLTFRKCKTLSSVTLPEGLLTIGDAVNDASTCFYNLMSLFRRNCLLFVKIFVSLRLILIKQTIRNHETILD